MVHILAPQSSVNPPSAATVHVLFVNEYLAGGRGISLLTKDEATELLTSAVTHAAGIHAGGSSVVDSYRRVATLVAEVAREKDAARLCSDRIAGGGSADFSPPRFESRPRDSRSCRF